MTGFADLIPKAQPAIFGGGVNASATEGTDWSWPFVDVIDNTGAAIDLTSATITCLLRNISDGSTALTLTGTGGNGIFTISAAAVDTAGLAAGFDTARYLWSCAITLSSKTVQVWDPEGSTFQVRSN